LTAEKSAPPARAAVEEAWALTASHGDVALQRDEAVAFEPQSERSGAHVERRRAVGVSRRVAGGAAGRDHGDAFDRRAAPIADDDLGGSGTNGPRAPRRGRRRLLR